MRLIGGRCLCCAAHGFACLVTAWRYGSSHSLLFDTGPEPDVLLRNVERLGVDLAGIEAIVLSHGHFDHVGALTEALDVIRARNGATDVPVYVHPGMFRSRAQQMPDGTMLLIEDVPDTKTMQAHGARVVETAKEAALLDGMFHVSGEIARTTSFERGSARAFCQGQSGRLLVAGPTGSSTSDLAITVAGKDLVGVVGCSHRPHQRLTRYAGDFPDTGPGPSVRAARFHLPGANEVTHSPRPWKRCGLSISA